jgi:hypothetical protein
MPETREVLAYGRIAIGAGALLAPATTGRLFGMKADDNPEAQYLGRLFGARDVVLGAGLLLAPKKARAMWWQAGIASDLLDVVSGLIAARDKAAPMPQAAMLPLTAATYAAGGIAGLRADG